MKYLRWEISGLIVWPKLSALDGEQKSNLFSYATKFFNLLRSVVIGDKDPAADISRCIFWVDDLQ